MRNTLFGTLLLAGISTFGLVPAFAQVATTDPAKVPAGTYTVDPNHTRILFSVSHMGFSTYYGDFTNPSGSLTFDPKAPQNSALSITIPTDSVSTTNAKLDGELKGKDWFDAAAYPSISFKSTKITVVGHDAGKITGELTLHGVTAPVTLTAHFNGGGSNPLDKKYTIGFEASGEISRSAFGVKTYVPLIGDTVKLMLSGAFEAQS